ncbi:hypothetical protein M0805_005606 [Coniferiporia weirii]|nr:hypothetical protein M0805_005606 [Coniferiporia weirii]
MSSAVAFLPQTPASSRFVSFTHNNRPTKSSPLAPMACAPSSSPGPISPVADAQARRRSQFKSRTAGPSNRAVSSPARSAYRVAPIPFVLGTSRSQVTAETGQAAFLRERFKAKCFERARRAREKSVQRRRASASDASSDGFDVDMLIDEADEKDDDGIFDDELFQRIVKNERRKLTHAYALSYELDVGSSFDPDIEDVAEWEEHVHAQQSNPIQTPRVQEEEGPSPPEDFDDPIFDEFDELEGDSAWVDEYIANLPVEPAEDEVVAATRHTSMQNGAYHHLQTSGSVDANRSTHGIEDVAMS